MKVPHVLFLNLFLIFLILYISLLPVGIVKKINIFEFSFSPSYLFLLAIILNFLILNRKEILKKIKNPHKYDLSVLFLLLLLLDFANGVNYQYLLSITLIGISFVTGCNFPELFGQKYFTRLMLSTGFFGIIGLFLFFMKIPLIDPQVTGSENYFKIANSSYYRNMSVFTNPNSYGYFLSYTIIGYGIAFLTNKKRKGIKPKHIIYFSIPIISLILTTSYSAFLTILWVFVILVAGKMIGKYISSRFLFFSTCFIVSVLPLLACAFEPLHALNVRLLKWYYALKFLMDDLFYLAFGVPAGTSVELMGVTFSDNTFLYLIVNGGIICSILMFYILFKSFMRSTNIIFYQSKNNIHLIPHAVCVMAFIFPLILSTFILFYPVIILWSISLGVVNSHYFQHKSAPMVVQHG